MDRSRPTPQHARLLANIGLVALLGLGPLGCSPEIVDDAGETGGGSCLLDGVLVISEVVADVPGADAGLEWFELYNTSGGTIDLQGLTLVYAKADASGRKTHTIKRSVEVPAGGYVVVSGILDELVEGMEHIDYGYANDLGEMANAAGYLAIGCDAAVDDDDIIDETYYGSVSDKASRVLNGFATPDAGTNNDLENWCDSTSELSPGFAATPRAANDLCGGSTTCFDGVDVVDVIAPVPGDLVITEVHPNPMGAEEGDGEWFEIHSLAGADFHLNNLQIAKSVDVEDKELIAASECLVLSPGEYAVVAGSTDMVLNGGLPPDTLVWKSNVAMSNSGGSRWVGIADQVLDAVTWGTSADGKSKQLDPLFFDAAANDDLGLWCNGDQPYSDTDFGTPGAANTTCSIPPPDGQCYEDGQLRDIMPVEDGDLEIVEVMPNPDAVADDKGEWFELLVKSSGDLNGMQIGKAGEVQDTVDFGDAPAFEFNECITVSPGDLVVFARDADPMINGELPQVDVVFDMSLINSNSDLFVGYGGVVGDQATWTSLTAGHSYSKDMLGNWCTGLGAYNISDEGTPGVANPACGGGTPGQCMDPDMMMLRDINPPAAGEVTISELMPDPAGAPDASGEWFELHASAAFDLNGLELGKANVVSHVVSSDMCIEIGADGYVVLARSDVDADNCALPNIDYVYTSLSLNNSNGNLQIGHGGVVFDETSWASVKPGEALGYDMTAMLWCDAVDPYGCGDLGSPGAVNPACDGMGNNDGMCMEGMLMRDIVAPTLGDVVISEFMANPAVVSDANGEWFELRALAPFDLNGLELGRVFGDMPLQTIASADCLPVVAGDTTLLARNGTALENGGLPAVDVLLSFGLTNSNSGLYVSVAGELLDQIMWTSVATGSSTSLDPDSYDPALNDVANNDGIIWCYAGAPYGDGDNGSPGGDNPQCN